MKKILLFLMACLLFAPPRALAEDRTVTIFDYWQVAALNKSGNLPNVKARQSTIGNNQAELSATLSVNNLAQYEYNDNGIKIRIDVPEQDASNNIGFNYNCMGYILWQTDRNNSSYAQNVDHTLKFSTSTDAKIKKVKITLIDPTVMSNINTNYGLSLSFDDRSNTPLIQSTQGSSYYDPKGYAEITSTGSDKSLEVFTSNSSSPVNIKITKIEVTYDYDPSMPIEEGVKTLDIFDCRWRTNTTSTQYVKYRTSANNSYVAYTGIAPTTLTAVETMKYTGISGNEFYVSLPTQGTPSTSMLGIKGYNNAGSAIVGNENGYWSFDHQRYLQFGQSYPMKISMAFGKIKEVRILTNYASTKTYTYDTFGKNRQEIDPANFESKNAGFKVGGATANAVLITIKAKEDEDFICWGFDGTNKQIYQLTVIYEEGEVVAPGKPVLAVNPGFGYEYDKETNTLSIPTFPAQTSNTTTAAYFMFNGGAAEELYYTFSKTLAVPTTPPSNTAVSNGSTQWVKRPAYSPSTGILWGPNIPTEQFLDSRTFTIRAVAYSPLTGKFSDVTEVNCKTYRLPGIDLDIDKIKQNNPTATDINYDAATKTLTYKGYNPKIYFKQPKDLKSSNSTNTGYGVYYNLTYTLITATSVTGSSLLVANEENNGYQIMNGAASALPVKGQTSQLNVLGRVMGKEAGYTNTYLDDANKGMVTFKIVSDNDGPDGPAAAKPVAAPTVSTNAITMPLSGGVSGYIDSQISVTLNRSHNWGDETPGTLQYQWVDASNGTWTLEPDPTPAKWTDAKDGKCNIEQYGVGRLFVRDFKDDAKYESRTAFYDFRYIATNRISDVAYNTLLGVNDNATVVNIGCPLRIIGFFKLSDQTANLAVPVYLMFVADQAGNVLRVHVETSDTQEVNKFEEAYKGYKIIENLTGELRKNKEMPELYLSNGTIHYSPLIIGPKDAEADYPVYTPTTVNRVPVVSDYSKLMYFGPLRWNADTQTFTDNKGGSVKLFQRIETGTSVTDFESELMNGVQYRIAGYVGYADGAPVILPRAYVAAPLLRAPNPINTEAEQDKLITMNVISSELELSVNRTGVAQGTQLQYFFSEDTKAVSETDTRWKSADVQTIDPLNDVIIINNEELSDGGCTLAARLTSGTMPSGVVTVRFNKVDATPVATIAAFKTAVANAALPDLKAPISESTHSFYQYTGHARIREVTPNYIYIRTTGPNGELLDNADENNLTDEQKKTRSDNSILIYTADGWEFDVVSVDGLGNPVAGTRTPLKRGDIITNFALIPTESGFGNLVANATGFIRTFRRAYDVDPDGSVNPIAVNAQANNVPTFTDKDLMLRYSIKNVQVSRTPKDGSAMVRDASNDASAFIYTLNLPGNPVLNNGDVFDANPDWEVMWSESAMFNLQGVLMMYDAGKAEGTDGRYMLAVIPESIEFSDAKAPSAPRITLEGTGVNNTDYTFVTEANVKLESTTADAGNATIFYTIDGSDPRYSSTRIIYPNKPFTVKANTVVKAYVRSNGTPNSEVAEAVLTRTAVDTRFIVNFISQAQEKTPYHLTATAKVVATGGDYFFLRGTQGHYLPVKDETGNRSIVNKLKEGDYVNDMVITPHIVETGVVRGAHVEADHKDFFKGKINKPANIDEIVAVPDEVYTLDASNARRYVKLMDVRLIGEQFNAEDELDTHDTSWKLTTKKGEGIDIHVDHTVLEPSYDWDETDQSAAACYDVTGFAMLGDNGEIEIWPTAVEKIKTSVSVRAGFSNTVYNSGLLDGQYDVTFYPYSMVTLTAVQGATIYYQITKKGEDTKPDQWNVYGQPFYVTGDCRIHAYTTAPGYEESAHTHMDMTLGDGSGVDPTKMSGKVKISHSWNENDVPVVKIEPEEEGLPSGSYTIYYTTDGTTPTLESRKYTGEFEMPGGGVVLAILKQNNKEYPGSVASLNIWYVPSAIGGIDSDLNSSLGVSVEGGNIIAPEGSEIYDINGRVVNAKGLTGGIYIVRVPGAEKAIKVKVD